MRSSRGEFPTAGWAARLLAIALLAAACPDPPVQPLLDARIHRLMQCQECNAGEMAAVVAMADSAVLPLRELILTGPPARLIARVDSALRMPVDSGGGPYEPPEQAIQRLLEDYRTIYRVRSSHALGQIGGDSARHAICAAKAAPGLSRREVQLALNSALVRMGGSCP